MKQHLLTTVDNPYHPIDEFDKWWKFDHDMGYCTSERLSKVAITSIYNTDEVNQRAINAAVDDFVRLMPELYKRIVVDD